MTARQPRRYAEGTTVDARKSQGEIAGILAQHGVTRQGWMHCWRAVTEMASTDAGTPLGRAFAPGMAYHTTRGPSEAPRRSYGRVR